MRIAIWLIAISFFSEIKTSPEGFELLEIIALISVLLCTLQDINSLIQKRK